ncbi:uncharacterized protein B0I36DRAFT_334544 [Microdochium trichocladiopsis]|uniref:Nephrocystin 3-like N-terminal domain-containing protein n=1 Tax=Microdochium trichocladiopsis TaxID=1682393 RepID=A0A9P9BKS2_9PEZI|nr:uncharacterized protein B0I36DRAFT_334544 [Microdochium trichocladiopsis]KAH7021506.1 hypothetical protein B0I36DRAFT_334544 [Microdochium trichocladiopsis]
MAGSCQWIEARADFQAWRNISDESDFDDVGENIPHVYWVNANPGTGKKFLAAHAGNLLRDSHSNCASYFFHFGEKASLSLSSSTRLPPPPSRHHAIPCVCPVGVHGMACRPFLEHRHARRRHRSISSMAPGRNGVIIRAAGIRRHGCRVLSGYLRPAQPRLHKSQSCIKPLAYAPAA